MFVIQGHLQEVYVCKQTFWLFQDVRSGSKKTTSFGPKKKIFGPKYALERTI